MDLRRKLAHLRHTPGSLDVPPSEPESDLVAPSSDASAHDPAGHLRTRLKSIAKCPRRRGGPNPSETLASGAWPFEGDPPRCARTFDVGAQHGEVALHRALEVSGEHVATLALDPALHAFDATTALFVDTETTGLAGAAGTLAFLVGLAWFEDRSLRVEQFLLDDLDREPALLAHVAEKIQRAGALVTFNGRTFDLPLLRARFVIARVPPPTEPPHLDLLHVARRVYGARVGRCSLSVLERHVLGFERPHDINSAEIPLRYLHFLREGACARALLEPVVTHNTWDLTALVALTGELGARAARTQTGGRFEARDLLGLARTVHRAGDTNRAVALATEAAAIGTAHGEASIARAAHTFAAHVHQRRHDARRVCEHLLEALALGDDPALHLALARCYERDLDDPERALAHGLRAVGAEPPGAHARRITRLRRKLRDPRRRQLPLPGFD